MSTHDYDDRPSRRSRNDRPPYPPDAEDDQGRSRAARDTAPASTDTRGKSDIPPPPLGSAMKREGSRTRAANLKPDFPEEGSYLNGRSPDLERKTGDRDRRFRERRDGYGSEEGESLKSDRRRAPRDSGRPRPPYDDGGRSSDRDLPVRGGPSRDKRRDDDGYDKRDDRDRDRDRDRDDRRRPARDYDDRPRQRRAYDDDDPPRRKAPRSGVEYGADPVKPLGRAGTDRRDDRSRRDRYDDSESEDEKARRRRSQPAPRRGNRYDDDDHSDRDARDRKRRDDDRDRRRPAPRRRSHDDYDDYYDRKDRHDKRDDKDRRDDKRRGPTHMKVGNVDIGPALDKGQKYYGVVAPLLTPIVMNYLKNKK